MKRKALRRNIFRLAECVYTTQLVQNEPSRHGSIASYWKNFSRLSDQNWCARNLWTRLGQSITLLPKSLHFAFWMPAPRLTWGSDRHARLRLKKIKLGCLNSENKVIKIIKGVHPLIFVLNIFPNSHLIQKCIHNQ